MSTDNKTAVAPEGWEDTVKKMKKHPEIDNPWALAWYEKNKGDKPGGKESSVMLVAKEFGSDEARSEYLKKHPRADPKNHTVKGKNPNEAYDPYGEKWKAKRKEKNQKDSDSEDKKIEKERAWAAGQDERDRKKKERYERDTDRRNKKLDKEEAKLREKKSSVVDAFEYALLVERVAARAARNA